MTKKSFKIKDNLANALNETVLSAKNNAGDLHVQVIPLKNVELDIDNPREMTLSFSDLIDGINKIDPDYTKKTSEVESLSSLAQSIVEHGIISPILVYKHDEKYRLIAGERRTLASLIARKDDIPAKILNSKPSALKISQLQWIENIERKDLTLWERLQNLEKIKSSYMKSPDSLEFTPVNLSRLLNCSIQQGVNYYHLLNSSDKIKGLIKENKINNIEKIAFISKSDALIQPLLIKACLEGASLKSLKKLGHLELKSLEFPSSISTSYSKISFTAKCNLNAAKAIINSVLKHEAYSHLHNDLPKIDWDDSNSVNCAFKKLLKILEEQSEVVGA